MPSRNPASTAPTPLSASTTCSTRRFSPTPTRSSAVCASEDPVHWDPFLHAWVVTRYADVLEVLHSYSADRTPTPEQIASMGLAHLEPDCAAHGASRCCSWTRPSIRVCAVWLREPSLRPASRCFVPTSSRSSTACSMTFRQRGSMDAIADLGEPLPAIITAEMLGVPVEDRHQPQTMVGEFAEMLGNFQHNPEHAQIMLQHRRGDDRVFPRSSSGEPDGILAKA